MKLFRKVRLSVLGCVFVSLTHACFSCSYRLFHLPTLRCQSPSQCPATTVWYTATPSAHWEAPTFCHWPTLLCRGIVCLLVCNTSTSKVQVTQVRPVITRQWQIIGRTLLGKEGCFTYKTLSVPAFHLLRPFIANTHPHLGLPNDKNPALLACLSKSYIICSLYI